MLKNQFKDKLEFDIYIAEQIQRKIKGYLTRSERDHLDKMIKNPNDYIKPEIIKNKFPLITNRFELQKSCQEVTKEDNIKEIIQKLKNTLEYYKGLGISANQIGINKKISYIKILKSINKKTRQLNFNEYILINAKIIEKDKPIKLNNEGCLSFPGIYVTTKRYIFCIVEYLNEKMELKTGMFQDLESFVVQHECDHQSGITLFQRKWKAK